MGQGRRPHPLFDNAFYEAMQAPREGLAPILDFLASGWSAERGPDAALRRGLVSGALFRRADVRASGVQAFRTHRPCRRQIAQSSLFDPDWYVRRNPDAAVSGRPAFQHFLEVGLFEGRDPHPLFDSQWYRQKYGESLGDLSTFEHYLHNGKLQPNRGFDQAYVAHSVGRTRIDYISRPLMQPPTVVQCAADRNVDASERRAPHFRPGQTLLDLYLAHQNENGLRPCAIFDPAFYKRTYPDIGHFGEEPLAHFLNHGLREGRRPCRELDLGFYVSQTSGIDPEAAFWSIWDSGFMPGIRPTPTYIPAFDRATLERMRLHMANDLPTILMISHFGGGGTSKHVLDLATALMGRANSPAARAPPRRLALARAAGTFRGIVAVRGRGPGGSRPRDPQRARHRSGSRAPRAGSGACVCCRSCTASACPTT